MDYQPIYTTLESVKRKLRSKLKVSLTLVDDLYSDQEINKSPIDNDLLLDTLEEVEDELNSILQIIYILPLINKHSILKSYVDKKVMSELLIFIYSNSDLIQHINELKQDCNNKLKALTYGCNVYIPNMMPDNTSVQKYTPIILEGESMRNVSSGIPKRNMILIDKFSDIPGKDFYRDNERLPPSRLERPLY